MYINVIAQYCHKFDSYGIDIEKRGGINIMDLDPETDLIEADHSRHIGPSSGRLSKKSKTLTKSTSGDTPYPGWDVVNSARATLLGPMCDDAIQDCVSCLQEMEDLRRNNFTRH